MASNITKTAASQGEAQTAPQLFDDWFDPIETAVRERAREFIEELIRRELDAALARQKGLDLSMADPRFCASSAN